MRVLVTGGAGFIGSHIVERLVARGDDVVVVDDFSTGKAENLFTGVDLVEGDLAEAKIAERAVKGVDVVCHCAASASVAKSIVDPVASNAANLQAATQLLVAARDAGVRRVVYSGTAAVYGSDLGTDTALETMREAPVSPYGMNKLAAEHLFRMAPELYGVDTACFRYFNIYGPRQDPTSPYSGVISIFTAKAIAGEAPTIFGDGRQSRDFCFVGDVARANIAALDADEPLAGQIMNLASGATTDLLALWAEIRGLCGRPDLEAEHAPARVGDIRDSSADVGAARRILGWQAEVSLSEGLQQTVAWYRAPLPHS